MSFLTGVWVRVRDIARAAYAWSLSHKVWAAAIIVVVLGGGYAAYGAVKKNGAGTEYVLAAASRGTLVVSVEGSGQVASNQSLDLSPKASGTITSVRVKAGDQVSAGQVIATVDDADAEKSLRDAAASLTSAQISYKQSAANASTDVMEAEGGAFDASASVMGDLPSILQNLDAALHDISTIPGHVNQSNRNAYAGIIGAGGEEQSDEAEASYQAAEDAYRAAFALSAKVSRTSSSDDIHGLITPAYEAAVAASQAEDETHEMMEAVNAKLVRADLSSATFASQLSTTATDESKINGDVSSALSAKNSLESATATLGSGSPTLSMQSAELSLQKVQNAYQDAEDALSDYVVVAPFSGTIAKVNVQPLDSASSGTAVATIITNESYAELSLNEVDAAKVKAGQKASLTFDAIDGLTLEGTVAEVDSIGTVSQGVVTYDVKISFDEQDPRVKPGMTVNASIVAGSAENALIVPSSAITTVGNQSFVQVVTGGATARSSANASTTGFTGRNRSASSTGMIASSSEHFRMSSTTASSTARAGFAAGGMATMRAGASQTVSAADVTIERVPVVVGLANDTETQIVSGLSDGALVVERTTSAGASASAAPAAGVRATTGGAGANRAFGGGFGGAAVIRAGG